MTKHTTFNLWSRAAWPGSTLPWTVERSFEAHYIGHLGVPTDGSVVLLKGRLWAALPLGIQPTDEHAQPHPTL